MMPPESQPMVYRTTVYEAICDLIQAEKLATTESIVALLGINRTIVNDAIKGLKERELIYSPERGIYKPVDIHPPARPMSRTILRNGLNKVEVGDTVMDLTPQEVRTLANLLSGAVAESAGIEAGRAMSFMACQLAERIKKLESRERSKESA